MKKKQGTGLRIVLIILSIAGMAVMGYLVSVHFSPEEGAFCNLGEGLSCDIVNKSTYAKLFGIPVSILGLLYFVFVFLAALTKYKPSTLNTISFLSIAFLGPSLYLTGVEIIVLKNICVFCEISKVLILAIVIVGLIAAGKERMKSKGVIAAVVLALVLGGVTYFVNARQVPSEKYNTFAMCLYEKGMRMYGSQNCSFCAKQRAMFGDAIEHVKEIECDPRFPNHEVERCVAKEIAHTPTWILENEAGEDVTRLDPGVQSLEKLSEVSGCPLPSD